MSMPRQPIPPWAHAGVLLLGALGFGLLAVTLGQDANWDLRNYHWYNAHALLGDRYQMDIAVAQGPTYYNPLPDLPAFLLAEHFSARATSFAVGALQSLNLFLLYLLGCRTLAVPAAWPRAALALGTAILGTTGSIFVSEVGTTLQDTLLSLPLLAGLLLVLGREEALRAGPGWRATVLLAGFLAGLSMGLKTTSAVWALGLCLAFLAVPGLGLVDRFLRAFLFGIAALAGMAVSGGWWFLHIWKLFGNPVFPYFNNLFRSPLLLPDSYKDEKFLPNGVWDAFSYPLASVFDPLRVSEVPFVDLRIPLLLLAALVSGIFIATRQYGTAGRAPLWTVPQAAFVAAFSVIGYLIWLSLFAIYRYAVVLEMVAPLALLALIAGWPLARRTALAVSVVLLAALALITTPADWGRAPWGENYVEVTWPSLMKEADPDRTMLLMTGIEPMGYVVPSLPPQIPVLRVQSYLFNPWNGSGFIEVARQRIARHDGALLVLVLEVDTDVDRVLAAYGLARDRERCQKVTSPLGPDLALCPVEKQAPG